MSLLKDVVGYGLHADRPAASSEGRLYYETDTDTLFRDNGSGWDTLGVAASSVAILNMPNTFTDGPNIFLPATSSDVSVVVKGVSGQTVDLQEWQNDAGTTLVSISPTGVITAGYALHNIPGVVAGSAGNVPWTVRGAASQTSDLQQWQDTAGNIQLGVANAGSGGSPIWALRIRALAHAESMGQTHTLGAYSGKSIQVLDDAGATVGWIPLYA